MVINWQIVKMITDIIMDYYILLGNQKSASDDAAGTHGESAGFIAERTTNEFREQQGIQIAGHHHESGAGVLEHSKDEKGHMTCRASSNRRALPPLIHESAMDEEFAIEERASFDFSHGIPRGKVVILRQFPSRHQRLRIT